MSKVSAFQVAGLELLFRSADHGPAHFHVRNKGSGWEIRVFIEASKKETGLDFTYKSPNSPSRRFRRLSTSEEKMLLELIVEHKDQLLAEWREKVCVKEVFDADTNSNE